MTLYALQLFDDVSLNLARLAIFPVEAKPHHRVFCRPVPTFVYIQASEQLLVSSLPSKSDFNVSTRRLFPNRRGRDGKWNLPRLIRFRMKGVLST